jgi:alginate biosynthesis protein AlgX
VRQGSWLLERADLITRAHPKEPLHRYLVRLSGALRARGTLPVALVMPTRAAVAYAQGGAHEAFAAYDPQAAALGYRDFLSRLRRAGFLAPDLLAAAHGEGDGFFFRRDHHWSPAGARASAAAVATLLRPHLEAQGLARVPFVTLRQPDREQVGTLQARAEAFCQGLSWPPETVAQFNTVRLGTARPSSADLAAALFGEVAVPVALAGTSNSRRGKD